MAYDARSASSAVRATLRQLAGNDISAKRPTEVPAEQILRGAVLTRLDALAPANQLFRRTPGPGPSGESCRLFRDVGPLFGIACRH
jgi:hypothetical protein